MPCPSKTRALIQPVGLLEHNVQLVAPPVGLIIERFITQYTSNSVELVSLQLLFLPLPLGARHKSSYFFPNKEQIRSGVIVNYSLGPKIMYLIIWMYST